jgi:hypothetical protein
MKKITSILLAIIVCSAIGFAQDTPFLKLFEKYNGKEGFTSVLIDQEMFRTMSEMMTEEETEGMSELMEGINGLLVLTYEYDSKSKGKNISRELYREFTTSLPLADYKSLVLVNDEGSNVKILAKKKDKTINELLILVGEETETTLVNINGNISLEQMSKLSKIMQMQEMDVLKEMNKEPEKGSNE